MLFAKHVRRSQAKAWLIVGLYVGAVYATLPVAPRLWFSLSPFLISFSSVATFVLFFAAGLSGCVLFPAVENEA